MVNHLKNASVDLLVALIAFLAILGAMTALAAIIDVPTVLQLGFKDAMLVILGALVTLLTRSGVNVTSGTTEVNTDDSTKAKK